jgi:hypothetical protein
LGGTADGYVELWFYPSPRSVVPSCADERRALSAAPRTSLWTRRGEFESGCVTLVSLTGVSNTFEQRWRWWKVEPMTGIEPAYSAWEADVLPLNYIGAVASEG